MQAELINDSKYNLDMVELRQKFASAYCEEKNWDMYNLSFEQVLEIRSHKEWTSPGLIYA